MNRGFLLITIVAVGAIGVGVGVWLSGVGQEMPLTGGMEVIDIGCEGSKLTAGYHDEMTNRSVFGTLSTLDGHPVPDQWVLSTNAVTPCVIFILTIL